MGIHSLYGLASVVTVGLTSGAYCFSVGLMVEALSKNNSHRAAKKIQEVVGKSLQNLSAAFSLTLAGGLFGGPLGALVGLGYGIMLSAIPLVNLKFNNKLTQTADKIASVISKIIGVALVYNTSTIIAGTPIAIGVTAGFGVFALMNLLK